MEGGAIFDDGPADGGEERREEGKQKRQFPSWYLNNNELAS